MLEVVIAVAVVAIGLYGLLEVHSNLQRSEIESYQRTQALLLLDDMASRISTNRTAAATYATAADEVTGVCAVTDPTTIPVSDPDSVVARDVAEWCLSLEGAGEKIGPASVGALVGGRGCVEDLLNGLFRVTVAWQGRFPLESPGTAIPCGRNRYNLPAGSECAEASDDSCRRAIAKTVRIGEL